MNEPAIIEQVDRPHAIDRRPIIDDEQGMALARRGRDPYRRIELRDHWFSSGQFSSEWQAMQRLAQA